MARIRCIKPELPQSESMGRISRDSRLTFIQLWTLADDEGRLRGNSRMLASLLFPYDDDAAGLIDGWLAELETEGCIARYKSEGQSYIQVCNWLIHQKIDKPSKSKIPAFVASSRILSNPLEVSSGDLRIEGSKDQGSKDQGSKDQEPKKKREPKNEITFSEWIEKNPSAEFKAACEYCDSIGVPQELSAVAFFEFEQKYTTTDAGKKYKCWELVLLKAIKENWLKVWYKNQSGEYQLTTRGQQAQAAMLSSAVQS